MNFADTTLVLPTLNEARNISKVISGVRNNFDGIRIIVVDDGSTDSTKEEVAKFKGVGFFDRSKRNLGKGLTASIIYGITHSKTKFVIVMDADLQHPFEKIKNIHSNLLNGSNLCVGTRKKVEEWPLYRQIISKTLMKLAELTLAARNAESCDDVFSGFFGVERTLFLDIYSSNKKRFVGYGYKVLFDFLKCIPKHTLRMSEISYTFRNRKYGTSKASLPQAVALLRSFLT